ncbi:uncharacterized protein TA16800 [Theileria annulata]|uniref:Mitochondrial import inner membrane translocase subunit TIM50 n=1 Tax=Theileria annulata TaxID=5874 RepID=Q4UIJ8_THEAN|nr:uncharacterized protein TA16800 [Theileria annulata]CAI73091.1 hypothetical protein, conserved [Theileria annulata]|eukprot:XP_953769.1 hypothetical protein, conserved [Theileria annulata]
MKRLILRKIYFYVKSSSFYSSSFVHSQKLFFSQNNTSSTKIVDNNASFHELNSKSQPSNSNNIQNTSNQSPKPEESQNSTESPESRESPKSQESDDPEKDFKTGSKLKRFRFLPFGIYGGALLVFSGFALSYYIDRGKDLKGLKFSQVLDDLTQYVYDTIEEFFPTDNSPLLPDFKELNYPPNLPTLVLDLDKVIAKMEYDRKLGWRVKKRPYADNFFKELINYYEIVIWSDDAYPVAYDIANHWGLPVIGCIHRDHCKKFKGSYIKDLSRLGRDLDRVVMIDHDKTACALQQDNCILIKEFDGDENDEELLLLINLLKTMAINPTDVKAQIRELGGGHDYGIGRRFSERFCMKQKIAEKRMNLSKMMGFKH